jgi:ribosomal protein S18 acetylase RimI-like enzyme
MNFPYSLRSARPEDQKQISALFSYEFYTHRHLDWRQPVDWLGSHPFWLLERRKRVVGALSCPPDPPEIPWVRFFAATSSSQVSEIWETLLVRTILQLKEMHQHELASLALSDWFAHLLSLSGFQHGQDIVVLTWEAREHPPARSTPDLRLRAMHAGDIEQVFEVDKSAFHPLWQISPNTLRKSFEQAAFATVAEFEGQIAGYQISTNTGRNVHLARLAVSPQAQRKGIGAALVQDLQRTFLKRRLRSLSVNTQNDNYASLALYQRMGFVIGEERFPVFLLNITD